MSTITPTTLGNSAIASAARPSPTRHWLLIGSVGVAAAATLATALAMSSVAPKSLDVASVASLLGRLLISAIFLISGIEKIRAPAWTINYIASAGLPFASLGLAIGIAVELVGGPALAVGYQTRLVAAVIVAYCVATAGFFHRDFRDQNQQMNFLKNIAIAGGLLQVIAFGGGSFSLDAV
jgi:putative oxidoreductase